MNRPRPGRLVRVVLVVLKVFGRPFFFAGDSTMPSPNNARANARNTGIKLRGRTVYMGPRGGPFFLTATGKRARLGKYDAIDFQRRVNNPNRLTRLHPNLLARITSKLDHWNLQNFAEVSRATRASVANRLAPMKAERTASWRALLKDLLAVLAAPANLQVGQSVGPFTVTTRHATSTSYPPSEKFTKLEGSRRIGSRWYVIQALVPRPANGYLGDETEARVFRRWPAYEHVPSTYEQVLTVHGSAGRPRAVFAQGSILPIIRQAAREAGVPANVNVRKL